MNETLTIHDIDWRCRVATAVAEDSVVNGEVIKKGTPITVSTFIEHLGTRISISDPSATALFLNQAHKAYQQAIQIHPFLRQDLHSASIEELTTVVYDYLEQIMASVIFAYTAIEAFADEEIPKNFTYETERRSGKIFVAYQKDSIERQIPLDEKLARALPAATGRPTPKGTKVWQDYDILRKLRDRIIHLKSADRTRSTSDNLNPYSIWKEMLRPKQPNYPLIAKNMILHFRDQDATHWLKYCPF